MGILDKAKAVTTGVDRKQEAKLEPNFRGKKWDCRSIAGTRPETRTQPRWPCYCCCFSAFLLPTMPCHNEDQPNVAAAEGQMRHAQVAESLTQPLVVATVELVVELVVVMMDVLILVVRPTLVADVSPALPQSISPAVTPKK